MKNTAIVSRHCDPGITPVFVGNATDKLLTSLSSAGSVRVRFLAVPQIPLSRHLITGDNNPNLFRKPISRKFSQILARSFNHAFSYLLLSPEFAFYPRLSRSACMGPIGGVRLYKSGGIFQ